jgi:hypothetical protein
MNGEHQWSDVVRQTMERAGWHEGRFVPDDRLNAWIEALRRESRIYVVPAAIRALREFGGLAVDQMGAGIDMAKSSFVIDPTLAAGEEDRFLAFEQTLLEPLVPIGEAVNGHAFLGISASGKVYLVADTLQIIGESIHEALGNLIEGRRYHPQ